MAKFTIEYNIHLGDEVFFIDHGVTDDGTMYDTIQKATVQDISQLPDVFVEGFRNENNEYTRWKKDITRLTFCFPRHEDSGIYTKVEYEADENVEFVHKGDVGTPEFAEIEYTSLKDIKKVVNQRKKS